MIKIFKQSRMEGNHLNKIKTMYEKPIENIMSMGKGWKFFLQDQEQDKDACFYDVYLTQYFCFVWIKFGY